MLTCCFADDANPRTKLMLCIDFIGCLYRWLSKIGGLVVSLLKALTNSVTLADLLLICVGTTLYELYQAAFSNVANGTGVIVMTGVVALLFVSNGIYKYLQTQLKNPNEQTAHRHQALEISQLNAKFIWQCIWKFLAFYGLFIAGLLFIASDLALQIRLAGNMTGAFMETPIIGWVIGGFFTPFLILQDITFVFTAIPKNYHRTWSENAPRDFAKFAEMDGLIPMWIAALFRTVVAKLSFYQSLGDLIGYSSVATVFKWIFVSNIGSAWCKYSNYRYQMKDVCDTPLQHIFKWILGLYTNLSYTGEDTAATVTSLKSSIFKNSIDTSNPWLGRCMFLVMWATSFMSYLKKTNTAISEPVHAVGSALPAVPESVYKNKAAFFVWDVAKNVRNEFYAGPSEPETYASISSSVATREYN